MTTPFLLFGSYGYTGILIDGLTARGRINSLSSRCIAIRLKAQADKLGLGYRTIIIDDHGSMEADIKGVPIYTQGSPARGYLIGVI
jgi:hypothetical protein